MLDDREAEKLVRTAAKRYARRSWWADVQDLEQEGRVAVVEAKRTFDPRVGVEPVQYVWRAILFAMRRALWAASAPVSGGSHRPRESYTGLHRADAETALIAHTDTAPPADVALDEARWRRSVRARLLRLSYETLDTGAGAGVAHRVLLEEVPPARLARAQKKQPAEVYGEAAKLRAAATRDVELYDLMKTRKE